MNPNYKVVIYKNKQHYKKIKNTKKYKPAHKTFKNKIKNNIVYFPKQFEFAKKPVKFEIALLGLRGKKLKGYNTKSKFFIKKIQSYYIEESFVNKKYNTTNNFFDLINIAHDESDVKTCIATNNHLIIEYSLSSNIELFTLKNKKDANRLYNTFKDYVISNQINFMLFFDYYSFDFQQNLYNLVVEQLNIDKKYLYKTQTT